MCGYWASDQWASTAAGFCQFADGVGHGAIEVAYQIFTGLACNGPTQQDAHDCFAFAGAFARNLDIYTDLVSFLACELVFEDIRAKCGLAGGSASVKMLVGSGTNANMGVEDMVYADSTDTCPAPAAATTCAVTHL